MVPSERPYNITDSLYRDNNYKTVYINVIPTWLNVITRRQVGNALRMAFLLLPQVLCRQPSDYETRSINLATMNA